MTKPKIILLFVIFVCSLFLRIYRLDSVPPGLSIDEVSNGYSAYSILKTGKDNWGVPFTLFSRHLYDYVSEFQLYALVPPVAFFGLNAFSIRLPAAILGSFATVAFYFLIVHLLTINNLGKDREIIGLIGSLLFAVNPWSIQLSRVGTEYGTAFSLFVISLTFFITFLATQRYLYFLMADCIGLISLYTYHSVRVVYPLLLCILLLMYKKHFRFIKKNIILILFINLICLLPLAYYYTNGSQTIRLKQISIFTDIGFKTNQMELLKEDNLTHNSLLHNRFIFYSEALLRQTIKQLSPDFLFLGEGENNYILGLKNYGKLLYAEILFIPLGILYVYRRNRKFFVFLLGWIFIGSIPAILSSYTPSASRGSLMLPALLLFAGMGVYYCIRVFTSKYTVVLVVVGYLICFSLYLHFYYVHFPQRADVDWLSFYKPAFDYLKIHQNKYNKIIFTPAYGFPHIFLFFYEQEDPAAVQKVLQNYTWDYKNNNYPEDSRNMIQSQWVFAADVIPNYKNYYFRPINWEVDSNEPNTLIVDNNVHEEADIKPIKTIYANNGSPVLYFFETK